MRYDYFCPNKECNNEIRDYEKSLNDPAPVCPKCGGEVERLFDRQTVFFKGFTTPGGNGKPNYGKP